MAYKKRDRTDAKGIEGDLLYGISPFCIGQILKVGHDDEGSSNRIDYGEQRNHTNEQKLNEGLHVLAHRDDIGE